jgi:thiol-disulfide isomerase/thioredoxin
VDFYTKGCTLCQAIEPVVGNVARATDAVGRVRRGSPTGGSLTAAVGLLNPRDDLDLIETYDVRRVPTLLLFVDGEPVDRLADGFQETEAVVDFVERRGDSR